MMWTLFCKECKQVLKSLVYYIYLVAYVLFITSQMGGSEWINELKEPQPGQENYGYGPTTDRQIIMESGIEELYAEISRGVFSSYPYGFYKGVTLNGEELKELTDALEDCTGKTFEELDAICTEYWLPSEGQTSTYEEYLKWEMGWHIPIREDYTYEEFEKLMQRASQLIGRGSNYEAAAYESAAMQPLTYEDAMANYRDLCEKDKVSGAQMRLFCDYSGVFLAVLPIFMGVFACLRDKRAKAAEVIYSKQVSGMALMFSRYLANVVMMFLPIVLCALLIQMPCVYEATRLGIAADGLAFLKYSVLWLLPLLMFVLAVAFLVTETTENLLAIPIQVIWGFGSIISVTSLVGNFGWKLVVRWNEFGGYSDYAAEVKQLYLNRGLYAVFAVVCILLTAVVYEKKR